MSQDNPYASPSHFGSQPTLSTAQGDRLPTYSVVMLIIDIVFRCIRILLVALGIVGILALGPADPIYFWGILEIITGVAMIVFGLLGDSLVLAKKKIGITLCWIALMVTVGNMIVGFCELPLLIQQQMAQAPAAQADAMKIGMIVGVVFMATIRLSLIIAYAVAVAMAAKVLKNKPAPLTPSYILHLNANSPNERRQSPSQPIARRVTP
jgi:hypothetical protein